jgi:YfiR/HmsC-like
MPRRPRPASVPTGAGRALAAGLLGGLLLLGSGVCAWGQDSLEAAVKATYLYKFAPFVEWPAGAAANAPLAICVIGADPFGPLLDRAVAGQSVGARPIVVRRLAVAAHDSPCQIAFLGGSKAQDVKEALGLLHGTAVLTVTDGGAAPGVVDFTIVAGRVRFVVDDQAAADNGLRISSKLLSLALSVKPRKPAAS